MVSRLRRRQRPRRFYRPAADVQYLKQLHLVLKKVPLQTGLRLHSRRNEQPPHQKACRITNSRRLTGEHCTSSDNDLRLGRLDSSSDCLRPNATVKRPSLTSPYEGREPAIKAKETEVWSAGGTDGLVGGGNRFGREASPMATTTSAPTTAATCPPTPHRRTAVAPVRTDRSSLPSSPQERGRDRPRTRTPPSRRTTCCATPPVQPEAQGGPRRGQPAHGATNTHAADGQPCSGRGARHAAADSATNGEHPSPPITEGRSGPLPTRRWDPTWLTLLPSTDDEHP
jgi:hypothetical protein